MLFSFEGTNLQDPVIIEKWSHLVPSRTQKLSTLSASIAICIDSKSSTLPVKSSHTRAFFILLLPWFFWNPLYLFCITFMEIFYEWFIEILIIEMKWKYIFSMFRISELSKMMRFFIPDYFSEIMTLMHKMF